MAITGLRAVNVDCDNHQVVIDLIYLYGELLGCLWPDS